MPQDHFGDTVEVSYRSGLYKLLLLLGAGETFHGEGILAVTKTLLQSGVSYVGGYQVSPAKPPSPA